MNILKIALDVTTSIYIIVNIIWFFKKTLFSSENTKRFINFSLFLSVSYITYYKITPTTEELSTAIYLILIYLYNSANIFNIERNK